MSERDGEPARDGARADRNTAAGGKARPAALPDAEAAALLARIRRATGAPALTWARAPERIPAGHESEIHALALHGSAVLAGPLMPRPGSPQ